MENLPILQSWKDVPTTDWDEITISTVYTMMSIACLEESSVIAAPGEITVTSTYESPNY